MAKRTTDKKSTPENADDQFNNDVCKLKHIVIDKEFGNMKDDGERRHEEIKTMIENLQKAIKQDVKNSHINLKDKIVLTEKIIGDKIDSLTEFDDTLKGNGAPGIWESIRSLNRAVKIIISIMIIMVIFELGGTWSRLNWDVIRKKLGISPKTKQEEKVEGKKTIEGTEMKIGEIENNKPFFVIPEEEKENKKVK